MDGRPTMSFEICLLSESRRIIIHLTYIHLCLERVSGRTCRDSRLLSYFRRCDRIFDLRSVDVQKS
jgi:hypothetical protein